MLESPKPQVRRAARFGYLAVLLVAGALGRDMLMAAPGTWEVLRFCFSGGGRTSLADVYARAKRAVLARRTA
jgi:hypothetical protein